MTVFSDELGDYGFVLGGAMILHLFGWKFIAYGEGSCFNWAIGFLCCGILLCLPMIFLYNFRF